MPITLLPSLILFSISKVVAPVASKMDPRYYMIIKYTNKIMASLGDGICV
jgi:hypothetical protein